MVLFVIVSFLKGKGTPKYDALIKHLHLLCTRIEHLRVNEPEAIPGPNGMDTEQIGRADIVKHMEVFSGEGYCPEQAARSAAEGQNRR